MDNIFYSEEELSYEQKAKGFFSREITPHIESMDREAKYPYELLEKLASQKYIGVKFPQEYGGAGKNLFHECIINEVTGATSIALACARSVPHHVGHCVGFFGSEHLRQKYLPPIFKAEKITAECVTESTGGSDVARMKTTATKRGSKYILNGRKRFMASGMVADYILIFAVTNAEVHPKNGISAFMVERQTPGIRALKEFDTMGWKGLGIVSEIILNDVEVDEENMVGSGNDGFGIIMDMLDNERVVVASGLMGSAMTCFDIAIRYSKQRTAFHRTLNQFEAISFKIADMAIKIEAARALRIKAARLIDGGVKATKEAAMAKILAAESAFDVISNSMQIMGGIGITTSYPIERHFRDARVAMIAVGTNEIMKLVIQGQIYRQYFG